jgi:hypothetical protein
MVREHSWVVLLDLSDRRRMPPGAKGAPDILFLTPGLVSVWFEAKGPGKKLRPAQEEWFRKLAPFLCWHRRYVCVDTWEKWLDAVSDLL